MIDDARRGGGRERAVSPVFGFALLVAIAFVGATILLVTGSAVIDGLEHRSDGEHAESRMVEVKSDLSSIAYRDDASTTVPTGGTSVEERGEIEFRVNGSNADGPRACSPHAVPLASIVDDLESGDEVLYQGGGVWRVSGDSSSVVSRPDLRYHPGDENASPTVSYSVLSLEGTGVGQGTTARKNASADREFQRELCLAGDDAVDVVHEFTITIRDTPAIDAWERYLEDEFDGDRATVAGVEEGEPGAVSVTVTWDGDGPEFGDPIEATIYGPLTAHGDGSPENRFTINDADGGPGWMVVDGDLDLQPDTSIDGYLSINGTFEYSGDEGGCPDLLLADDEDRTPCTLDGNASIDPIDPIDDEVDDALERLEGADPLGGGPIETGQYYVDDATGGDALSGTIDTSEGPVEIGVAGGLVIEDLAVVGSEPVRIYAGDDVSVTGRNTAPAADSVWIYGTSSSDVRFYDPRGNGHTVTFTGTVYAPGDGGSTLSFANPTDVVGAVVGGELIAQGNQPVTINYGGSTRTDLPADPDDAASADLEVLAHEVAEEVVRTEEERLPLDTVFVLDRSGSMDPPDDVLSAVYTQYDGQAEPVYTGPAAESPLSDDGLQRTYEYQGAPRHQLYVDEGGEWVPIGESSVGEEVGRECTERRGRWCTREDVAYDVPADREIRVDAAGFDPAGVRVDATRNFIDDALDESAGDRAAYVDFNGDGHERVALTDDLETVRDALTDEAGGGTNIPAGIRAGLEQYDDRDGDRVMVLLGDGENDIPGQTAEEADEETLEAAEEAADDDVGIYTVGLGDEVNGELFEEVAEITDGEYFHADDADELTDAFEDAGEAIGESQRYIEHKDVETRVGDGAIVADTYTLSPGEPRSITVAAYDCAETDSLGEADERDGVSYEHRGCADRDDSSVHEVDDSIDTGYDVYEDGDALAAYETGWWQDGLSTTLREKGLLDGTDRFDLEANERVVVVHFEGEDAPTGYAAFKFAHNPPTLPDGSTDSIESNTYVLDVHSTQITIES